MTSNEKELIRAVMKWYRAGNDPMRAQDDLALDRACKSYLAYFRPKRVRQPKRVKRD